MVSGKEHGTVGVVVRALMTRPDCMDAFDTDALDFVGRGLCMCLGLADGTLEFMHDSAHDGTALSVTIVGGLSVDRDDD